jgi:hypothetical protein
VESARRGDVTFPKSEEMLAQVTVQRQKERRNLALAALCVGVFKLMFPEKTSPEPP